MAEHGQAWNLFGFDVRRVGHYFRSGWRDFLWGGTSPVLAAVDEIVRVHMEDGDKTYFRAGRQVPTPAYQDQVVAEAVAVPDHLLLAKTLRVPAAAEADIDAVIALEVRASSPFPGEDTCFGWTLLRRDETELAVQLVISSQSAVMAYVGERFDCHDIHVYEIWAFADDAVVPLTGFGEGARHQRNRQRMVRAGMTAAYCMVATVVIFALAAGMKYVELQRVQAMQADATLAAKEAVQARSELVAAREIVKAANQLRQDYPSPYTELKRLTGLLGDDTWLSGFEMRGTEVRIQGETEDASAVMQNLLDQPAYATVIAPNATSKVRSGMERFVLEIETIQPAEMAQ